MIDLEGCSAAQALVGAAIRVEVEPLRQPLVDIGTVDVVLEIDVLVLERGIISLHCAYALSAWVLTDYFVSL